MTKNEYNEIMQSLSKAGLVEEYDSLTGNKNYFFRKDDNLQIDFIEGFLGEGKDVTISYYIPIPAPSGRKSSRWTCTKRLSYNFEDLENIIIDNGQVRVMGTIVID